MIQIWQAFSLRGCPTNACLNGPEFQRPSSTKVTVWNMFIRLNQFFFGFRPRSFACAFLLAKLGFMIFFFKFIQPLTIQGPPCDILHCNYNGVIHQKIYSVITFDWRVLLTQKQHVWTTFCKIFSGTPHHIDHIWSAQICIFGPRSFMGL